MLNSSSPVRKISSLRLKHKMRAQNVLYLRDASLQISAKRFQLFGSKRRADDADLGLRIRVDPHQAQINIAFDYNVSAVTSATPRLGPAASLSLFIPPSPARSRVAQGE
jgi:hypothetical protein